MATAAMPAGMVAVPKARLQSVPFRACHDLLKTRQVLLGQIPCAVELAHRLWNVLVSLCPRRPIRQAVYDEPRLQGRSLVPYPGPVP
jgi:hypothetical protein